MKKKAIISIVIFVIIAGIGWWKYQSDIQKKKQEEENKPEPIIVDETLSASGTVQASHEVTLTFQTAGMLMWLGISEGDHVEQWQALASLDTYTLERQLKDALIAYSKERNDFDEATNVTYRGMKPQDALTDTVKRILENNQWDLDDAINDVEIKNQAVKLATLVSPIDGIVTSVNPSVAGVNVTPATASIVIADPDSIQFVAEVDEFDISTVHIGQAATITLDAFEDTPVESHVERVAFTATQTSGGGTAYNVYLTLPSNVSQSYKIGMNGDVEFSE